MSLEQQTAAEAPLQGEPDQPGIFDAVHDPIGVARSEPPRVPEQQQIVDQLPEARSQWPVREARRDWPSAGCAPRECRRPRRRAGSKRSTRKPSSARARTSKSNPDRGTTCLKEGLRRDEQHGRRLDRHCNLSAVIVTPGKCGRRPVRADAGEGPDMNRIDCDVHPRWRHIDELAHLRRAVALVPAARAHRPPAHGYPNPIATARRDATRRP